LYEEGDDVDPEDFSSTLKMMLEKCPGDGVKDGSVIAIDDSTQDLMVSVIALYIPLRNSHFVTPTS
jgi:hypothetical protein